VPHMWYFDKLGWLVQSWQLLSPMLDGQELLLQLCMGECLVGHDRQYC